MNKFKALVSVTLLLQLGACGDGSSNSGNTYTGTGSAGSLAAMTTTSGQLHILDANGNAHTFDLTTPMQPTRLNNYAWANGQTLFNYRDSHLLIGRETGVLVYRLPTEVDRDLGRVVPQFTGRIDHIRAYDPVIAVDNIAYFTTRDGDPEQLTRQDQMSAADISEYIEYVPLTQQELNNGAVEVPPEARLLANYSELPEPYGLGYLNEVLYICDGHEGLTQFTVEPIPGVDQDQLAEGEFSMQFVRHPLSEQWPCSDVIATEEGLILTSAEGVAQLQIGPEGLQILSLLPAR